MNIIIIDDEKLAIDLLSIVLDSLAQFSISIRGTFTDAMDAFALLEREQIDLVFLDIEMLDVNGLEIATTILAKYPYTQLIFVTAHAQFAVDAFDVAATDYLLKPVQEHRLERAMIKAQNVHKTRIEQQIDTKKGILYAQVLGSFQLLDNKQNIIKWRTKKVRELFLFLWLHRQKPILNIVIIDNLWPEVDVEKSSINLHTSIYQLRKAIKPYGNENPISLVNNHYQLTMKIESDYDSLEALLEIKKHDEHSIKKLIHMYEDDFLASEPYPWAIGFRLKVKQAVLDVLESYITNTKEISPLLKLNCLQRMVELEEYNEEYMYLLLQCFIEQNKKQACKQFYESICEKWQEELGLPVPEKIITLYRLYVQ